MCGIFAYCGVNDAASYLVKGLKRLEYRGYDSWGVSLQTGKKIYTRKKVGKLTEKDILMSYPSSTIGIAHTRWATTGAVTQKNAHPHFSSDKTFVLAQNGIVENYKEIKERLVKKGYRFISQTDTEVIVRLIEDELKSEKNFLIAVNTAFKKLEGRNTIIILRAHVREIIAARNGSPLVIGKNDKTAEIFISSDTLSCAPFVNKVSVIDNGTLIDILDQDISLYEIKTMEKKPLIFEPLNMTNLHTEKDGFDHYMQKEIFDTPLALEQIIKQPKKLYQELAEVIKAASRVYTIGSGTAGIAASQIAFYLREYAQVPAVSLIGADAREYYELFSKNDLIIAPSQSGETADVLEVLEYAKKMGVKIATFVNMPGSMMTRMSDYPFMSEAGAEICVLSTKVFTSQIAWGYLLAKTVAGFFDEGVTALKILMKKMENYLHDARYKKNLQTIVKVLLPKHDIFLLGKYQNINIVKEGMVKLIEGTYKHAHAIPAGDLKHYAITLMEKGVPVIVAVSDDKVRADVISAVNEVRARGASIIGLSPENSDYFSDHLNVPATGETQAIMNVIPLQLLAYYLGVALGNDIDKPRNIAKSVTVK